MKQPLSIVAAAPEDEFARTLRLCESVKRSRIALESVAIRLVTESRGALAERVRVASDLSGIPRGVIEQMLKDVTR